ncbi:diguanylate cyclase [Paracidovorax avenae]
MGPPKHPLRQRIYPLRALGMGLGGIAVATVLWEDGASHAEWAFAAFVALVWPHAAFVLAGRSADPYRAEIRNLLVDSALVGALVPLMHFNLLPSLLLCLLTMQDKVACGIRGLWARSLPGMAAAGLASAAATGLRFDPHSSMEVIVACMPVMVLHSMSVSLASHRLIRKVSHQNQQLEELRRIDALTGLYGRGHWQEQAEAALGRFHAENAPTSLLMLDIDHFKDINDRWGHSVGDEVIRTVARLVRSNMRATDCAGRYGGDEFAVILRGRDRAAARLVAERIRAQAQEARVHGMPQLQFTCSIGIAALETAHTHVRDWVDAADAALYQAKRHGRNGIALGAGGKDGAPPC